VRLNIPRARAETAVNTVFAAIGTLLKHVGRVELRGFGSFEMRDFQELSWAWWRPRELIAQELFLLKNDF